MIKKPENDGGIPSSFRDPAGFLFRRGGLVYRQINTTYKENYDLLISSRLYEHLVDHDLLIPHKEVVIEGAKPDYAYKLIEPELIPFISYPYEWSFSQLKDAAITTLRIQKISLGFGMSLRDCSAYNIQFRKGRPIFIDTLSFENYREGRPWVAYRQFCQHFLAPLALMSFKDVRLNQLLRIYIDGIPLNLASSLLPTRTRFSLSLLMHLHLHARSQAHYAGKKLDTKSLKLGINSLYGIIDQLADAIKVLKWHPRGITWANYYEDNNYSMDAFEDKKELVAGFLGRLQPRMIWDLGANIGVFSRIAGSQGIEAVSFDMDPAAVEINYLKCIKEGEARILPLVMDLTNPSPGIGWENNERSSLAERGPADTVLALALVHHLAISNNVPLDKIACFLSRICKSLVIEFVPKTDSQVKRLLASRDDIFTNYTKQGFEQAFARYFSIEDSVSIRDSERILYVMRVLSM